MSTIKVIFVPSACADLQGAICYQIMHEGKRRQLFSDFSVFPHEWDKARSMVAAINDSPRKHLLISIRDGIRQDIDRLNKIIHKFQSEGLEYSAGDVVSEYYRYAAEYSLFNFMESLIANLKQNGKMRTAETYASTLNSFRKFRNGQDIMLDALSSQTLEAFEAWHRQRGLSANTISFYNRILRAAYNRAVEDEIIDDRRPFRHVYTGIDKTVKRALPLRSIKIIKNLDLSHNPGLDFARDMFIMSFMLRGMSFIDMAYLRKADLANGCLTYRRRKTGQLLAIQWTPEMQLIIDKYPRNDNEYLLPIIRKKDVNERSAYRNAGYNINHSLKLVAKKAGIAIPLTLYVARHSWASAAKAKGIPLAVISQGMGHDSEATTRIYLASLDTSVVDKANSIILSSL